VEKDTSFIQPKQKTLDLIRDILDGLDKGEVCYNGVALVTQKIFILLEYVSIFTD